MEPFTAQEAKELSDKNKGFTHEMKIVLERVRLRASEGGKKFVTSLYSSEYDEASSFLINLGYSVSKKPYGSASFEVIISWE